MYRHPVARRPRLRRPAHHPRGGFTLVELLVVITIIAMLVGLLIPAIQAARERGRYAQCLNNQREVGTAITNYVTSKDHFPPLYSQQPDPKGYGLLNPRATWVPPLLSYLGNNPLYQAFQNNQWNSGAIASAEISTLICPSRNPTDGLAPLSYVVNAGMSDWFISPTPPAGSPPLDLQANGIFFDEYATAIYSSLPKTPRTDLSYLSKHDGAQYTLLFSENLDALDWVQLQNTPASTAPPLPSYTPMTVETSYNQAIIWYLSKSPPANWGTNAPPTGAVLNKVPTVLPPYMFPGAYDLNLGRPSSNHSGGFIVTFCSGNARFMSEDIEYRVYCLLMSPDSQKARDPRYYTNTPPLRYPANWYVNSAAPAYGEPIKPVTDADLQ